MGLTCSCQMSFWRVDWSGGEQGGWGLSILYLYRVDAEARDQLAW